MKLFPQELVSQNPAEVDVDAIGWDTETHRIAMGAMAPKIVCLTSAFTMPDGQLGSEIVGRKDATAEGDPLKAWAFKIASPVYTAVRVGHNVAFDLGVLATEWPELLSRIFTCLEAGRFQCTKVREKLLRLATTGDLDFITDGQGKPRAADYSLAGLVKHYFGIDISADKKSDDAWRLNFSLLEDTPTSLWPPDAVNYAKEDAVWALAIKREQEKRRQQLITERGIDPFVAQNERVMFDFALFLISCQGVMVDHDYKAQVSAWVSEQLDPSQFGPLYEAGILIPAVAPKAKKKGGETKGSPEKKSVTTLREYVLALHYREMLKLPGVTDGFQDKPPPTYAEYNAAVIEFNARNKGLAIEKPVPADHLNWTTWVQSCKEVLDDQNPIKLRYTDASTKFPEGQLSVDGEFLEDYAHMDPNLELLEHRESLQKLVTTELPRMCVRDDDGNPIRDAEIVHPQFDSIKSTGRSSSSASKIVPSFNCQNVHPKVRPCFMPRPGYLFFSIDFSFMELCTWAQACLKILGHSRLAEIINSGADPHAWLGSMLAQRIDPHFSAWVGQNGGDAYGLFMSLKNGDDQAKAFFKKWRTFAKPTGLGFPGGLSSKTMVKYAKSTYKITLTEELAAQLREAWLDALPEAKPYFDWVKQQEDPYNIRERTYFDKDTGEKCTREEMALGYFSPLGTYRAGCDYCAVANGEGLQTWSADGMLMATIAVVRACFDPAWAHRGLYSLLRPLMLIHDEIVGEVVDTPQAGEYAVRCADLMVEAFSIVLPDVKIKAQPVLMRRWHKEAEPVFDAQGRLIPWEPAGTK